jgi:type VI secretion system ImpM family protein
MTRAGLFQRLRQQIGGAKQIELPVSCYGKLPFYKDFLREKLVSKDAQAFRQWLDKGISHFWGPSEAYQGETIYPHAFLFRFPGTGSYIVGYLWGSHDQGELRFFPFSLFTSLPAGREAYPPHAILEVLESIVAAGRRWHHESSRLASHQDFKAWSRALTLQVTIRPEQAVTSEILSQAEDITIGEYADDLWEEGSESEWPALLSYLKRYEERIRERRHPTDLAIRFPSSKRMPLVQQAQYWTLILEQFDSRRERPCQILVPAYDDKAGITMVLRSLRPDDVYALHPEMRLNEHIEDVRCHVPRLARQNVEPLTLSAKNTKLRSLLDHKFSTSPGSVPAGR